MMNYLNTRIQAVGASATEIVLSGRTNMLIVTATQPTYINLDGDEATAENSFYVPSGIVVDIPLRLNTLQNDVPGSQVISVLQAGSGGSITIVEIQET